MARRWGGAGSIIGPVNILSGGHLSPGNSPGTFTTGTLTLNTGSILDFELNTPDVDNSPANDLVQVNGDLTLNGTLNLSNSGNTTLAAGKYRLINYTGTLTNPTGTLTFGTLPGSTLGPNLFVQTSVTGQVNLISSAGLTLTVWDGGNAAQEDNSIVEGGDGVWDNSSRNWTTSTGEINGGWTDNGVAVFQGTAGTVTVSTTTGPVNFSGAQFTTTGYTITGGVLTTSTADTQISIGSGLSATIASVITGTGGLDKVDAGTLTLSGANDYSGGTTIAAGTLHLTGAGALGSGAVGIASGTTLFIDSPTSGDTAFNNVLTGSGIFKVGLTAATNTFDFGASTGSAFTGTAQLGNSSFALSGSNTTALSGATLQLDTGNTTTVGAGTQTIGSLILNGGTLVFSNLPTGTISTGALTLTTGTVQIDPTSAITAGTLLAQDEGASQKLVSATSVTGDVSGVALTDLTGTALTSSTANVVQGGNTVAVGSYTYALGTGSANDGLYASYSLTQLALQAGQTTSLSGDSTTPAGADEFHAKLTGSGNLSIDATTSITLNNAANDYTGTTTVSTGSLILGNDNVLGATKGLIINIGATTDLNGHTQTIGTLDGGGILSMNAGSLAINNGGIFSGSITGTAGSLTLTAGTMTLPGLNTYTGTTTIDTGAVLNIGNGGALGSYAGDIVDNGSVTFNRNTNMVYAGVISGTGSLTQIGSAGLTLTGDNIYSGGTTVAAGTLQIGDGGTTGSVVGDIVNTSNLSFKRSDNLTLAGVISGSGFVVNLGTGTTILTGANTYTGGTAINAGAIQIGDGGTTGSIISPISDNALLIFNRSDALTYSNVISGTGALTQAGTGTTTLTGVNTYAGITTVSAGTLRLNGAGAIGAGNVAIASGATLFLDAPGSGNTTFGNVLTGNGLLQVGLTAGANTFDFGSTAGSAFAGTVRLGSSSFALSGSNTTALTGATLQLDAGNTTTVGAGIQTIGNLTMNGGTLAFANLPTGTISTGTLTLTSGTIQINPSGASASGNLLLQDEGGSKQLIAATSVSGAASALTLTDLTGAALSSSTADIDQSGNTVAIGTYAYGLSTGSANDGLYATFSLTQLALQAGQTLTLSGDTTTPAGANELHALLTGSGNLAIDATASLTLNNAANNYTGSTTVDTGTLILGSNSALGATSLLTISSGATTDLNGHAQTVGALGGAGSLLVNGGNLTLSNGGSFGGVMSGTSGNLNLTGGTLILTGENTYTGTTTLSAGSTFQIGSGGASGSYAGNITDNGSLVFNRSGSLIYANAIVGSGSLTQAGSGTTILSGANLYTGGTTISAGTLQIGNNNFTGSITGNILNNSALVFDRTNFMTYGGVISGTGTLAQAGSGTLILTGTNTYTGATNVNAGSLLVNGALGNTTLTVASGATLGGNGVLGGPVSILSGGHLAPGNSPGTITMGALTLAAGSVLDYELNTPNVVGGGNERPDRRQW